MARNSNLDFLKTYRIPLLFSLVKLLAHFLTNSNYGLHRDEYLYLDLGRHLGWGFMEVPPVIAVLAAGINAFGAEVWVVRLAPTLAGTILIFLVGWQVQKLKGSEWAQGLACLGFLLAPAYLRGNTLFQPVTFNQFMWFISCLLFVELVRTQNSRIWYGIGVAAGIGILTKYSIALLYLGLGIGLLLSAHRIWFRKPYPYFALGLALLIAAPNLWWQVDHNLPIVAHMKELTRTQLVNVEPLGFTIAQFLMLFSGAVIAISGLIYLFVKKEVRPYHFIGVAALATIGIIGSLSGKPYYTLGIYPMLMVFGGMALDQWIRSVSWKWAMSIVLIVSSLVILPYSLLILPLDQMRAYCAYMKDTFGLSMPLRWEDGRYYEIPQDYADMFGWDEMAKKVISFYEALPESEKEGLVIQGGSYGHAGAINYFGRDFGLPEAYSFNGSYRIWVPEEIPNFQRHILVDDRKHYSSNHFNSMTLVDSVANPFARDPGYIYYRTQPKVDLPSTWRTIVQEEKAEFNFH